MLILLLAFLTGCFAGYDYYDYPAYNNNDDNNEDVLRKPPQIGRAKLDNNYVGGGKVGDRMSMGVRNTVNEPILGGIRGSINGAADGSVGGDELNDGLGGASGLRDKLGVQSKDGLASDNVDGVGIGISGGGGFSGNESNEDGILRGGGGSFGGGNSVNGGRNVGGVGVDEGLGGVADYAGADYAEADAKDFLDLDKEGISSFLGISEQMGGGFKPMQHQSILKIPAISEFGDDYADEDIPANNKLSYLGLLDGLHIQDASSENRQDYDIDYAVEEFPADPESSFMGLIGK